MVSHAEHYHLHLPFFQMGHVNLLPEVLVRGIIMNNVASVSPERGYFFLIVIESEDLSSVDLLQLVIGAGSEPAHSEYQDFSVPDVVGGIKRKPFGGLEPEQEWPEAGK